MTRSDDEIKDLVAKCLERLGFSVSQLKPRLDQPTPDLLASRDGERFLIEIKSKFDDPQELLRQREVASSGGIAEWSESWSPRNTVSAVVENGVHQLKSFPRDEFDFGLLWLHGEGLDAESQFEQFAATLYGLAIVFALGEQSFRRDCYYFHESSFFRWREHLDGAVISAGREAQICLNTLSARVERLRESSLARAMAGGVRDPAVLEAKGLAAIADFEADRRDSNAVIQGLQRKYEIEMLDHMQIGSTMGWIEIDAAQE